MELCLSQACRDMKGCLLLLLLLLGTVSALYLGECSPSLLIHLPLIFLASFFVLVGPGPQPTVQLPQPLSS